MVFVFLSFIFANVLCLYAFCVSLIDSVSLINMTWLCTYTSRYCVIVLWSFLLMCFVYMPFFVFFLYIGRGSVLLLASLCYYGQNQLQFWKGINKLFCIYARRAFRLQKTHQWRTNPKGWKDQIKYEVEEH